MISHDKAFESLLDLGDLSARRNRTEVLDRAMRTALLLLDADAVALTTTRRGRERMVLHAGSLTPAALPLPPEGSEVMRRLAETCQPLALDDWSEDAAVAVADGCPGIEPGPVLFTPVQRRDGAPGYVAIYRRRGRARFVMNDHRLMLLLSSWLGATLETLRLATGTEKRLVVDGDTGVYNFRYLQTALQREVRRARRFGHELSILKVEVDHLATHRTALGERETSLLLNEVAAALAQQVRSFDVLGRHGDEHFMLILPQTGREGATEVAERIRAAVEQTGFSMATGVRVSLGVASFPDDAGDVADLEAAVERAFRLARESGNGVATPSIAAA
jgi:diguanylate cyclase (GGDEF)-like protein